MLRCKIPLQIIKSFSVTRKSRTSACRRSMCSTRKMPHNLSSAKKSPGAADVAAADAAAVDAAGTAAGAVAVVAAVGLPGGARPGVIAAGVRRNSWRRKRAVSSLCRSRSDRSETMPRDGRRKSLEQIFRGRTRSSVGQRSYSRSYSKCKRALPVVVLHDEAGVLFLDGPRRRGLNVLLRNAD